MEEDEPKNPKQTTDGKQTTGHSYSTRSKAKRTSHSGDDSSGSQAQEPPLKRQTRLSAKQADKSVKIKKYDATPDSNAVDTNTVEEYTPAQTALKNDLVLESLFRYMNGSDLLTSRIVTKQWQNEATKELRRRKLVIRFSFPRPWSKSKEYLDIRRRLSECKTPSLLSSLQVKIHSKTYLGSARPTSVFTTVGNHLKCLTLHLNYSSEESFCDISYVISHLEKLLFCQAPNLEFLEITFHFPGRPLEELEELELYGPDEHHPYHDNNEFLPLPNLKTFIVSGTPPTKFFADVMNAAVNLRSVGGVWSTSLYINSLIINYTDGRHLTTLEGFSSACIKYFLGADGRRKIHLLKSFRVYLADYEGYGEDDELEVELMETFLMEHKQNLQLETFDCVSSLYDEDPSFAPRTVGIINLILECSSGSLKKLRIAPAKLFADLLIIPRLPKLQEICFDCFGSDCRSIGLGGRGFLPRGFNMNNSFPNVSSIVFLRCTASLFRRFLSRMEIEMTEPVPSIWYITLIDKRPEAYIDPPLATVTDFRHVFPNLVSISCVNKEKYYKI